MLKFKSLYPEDKALENLVALGFNPLKSSLIQHERGSDYLMLVNKKKERAVFWNTFNGNIDMYYADKHGSVQLARPIMFSTRYTGQEEVALADNDEIFKSVMSAIGEVEEVEEVAPSEPEQVEEESKTQVN